MAELEVQYDRVADAAYVWFARKPFDRSEELDEGRRVDYAADGSVIGIELLGVSNGVDVAGLPEADAVAVALRRHSIRIGTAESVAASAAARLAADSHWQRTALARAVARAITEYRARHGLSIRALAVKLGMQHPTVARLEAAEHNPSIETLERLSSVLGLRFVIDIRPEADQVGPGLAEPKIVQETPTAAGGQLVVAVGERDEPQVQGTGIART